MKGTPVGASPIGIADGRTRMAISSMLEDIKRLQATSAELLKRIERIERNGK